ncbi:MAG: hypothetical protein OWQ48_03225 [Desulfurococcus sp.]|nr:hypothetical protein [Desulfurococcus sp.]
MSTFRFNVKPAHTSINARVMSGVKTPVISLIFFFAILVHL